MYNGIGLTTARGSGTSGYVQKNLSSVNKSKQKHEYRSEQDIARLEAQLNRPPNADILLHQRKRQIEVKCLEERVRLEDQGVPEDEIERRLVDYRALQVKKSEEAAAIKEHKVGVMFDDAGRPL